MTIDSHLDTRPSDQELQELQRLLSGGVPEPSFAHLVRMSDDTGLFEHARGPIPKRWHGYCVDDVTRGLIVICREPDPSDQLVRLAEIYLAFLLHAQDRERGFHNRMGLDRVWHDEPETGEWWGRGVWALGTAANRGPTPWIRAVALERFDDGAKLRAGLGPQSRLNHAMAYAALGAAEVAEAHPGHPAALSVLADAAVTIGRPAPDPAWPWPEPRLEYGDPALPEALIAAGQHIGDETLLRDGLGLLEWLLTLSTRDGHLSPTPAGGWSLGDPRPAYHQQPIEAAAYADACARAFTATRDRKWLTGVRMSVDWFLGVNDSGIPMIDDATGGCFDGLGLDWRNPNQGAESTIALISTLQHARWLERIPAEAA
ncbi:glycosyltransferase [Catenulispora rubra]|uniref:glycosyltransferase n=1 Tax=Catenulispora rubra TaxID=280293 RepID=UPI0018920A02|nr:glycosyltransferase [Catenulispora rubra]